MIQPTYAAARLAADRINHYLASHSVPTAAHANTLPDSPTLAALIDVAFWTSLRREEGYVPRISLAFVAPGQGGDSIVFARSLSLSPRISLNSLQLSKESAFILAFGRRRMNFAFGGSLDISRHLV